MKNPHSSLKIFGVKRSPVKLGVKNDLISEYCVGKDVLHIGCTDSPLTTVVWKRGDLLHLRLENVAKSLIGVDLDVESLDFLKRHGISNVIEMNAENITLDRKFDVIVAGDVLEHMNNPGLFLQQVPSLLNKDGLLVLSVPIASAFASIFSVWLTGTERVHQDHCFYFSPKTLSTLCYRYDLLPVSLFFVNAKSTEFGGAFINLLRKILIKLSPFTATQIVMAFKKKSEVDIATYIELH